MSLFNKILVPVDFSTISIVALDRAIETAVLCNSNELHLISVVDINTIGYLVAVEPGVMINYGSVDDHIKNAETKMLVIKENILKKHQVNIKYKITVGNLFTAINEYTETEKIDLIVMATSGSDGIKEFIFGSNSQYVAEKVNCPILTVKSNNASDLYKKIILPIENFYPKNKLAFAKAIAKIFKSEIHLVCLKNELNNADKTTEHLIYTIVEELNLESIPHQLFIAGGKNITDAILRYAEKASIDLILVNPGEESTLTGKIIDALGGQIINHAQTPVLTIKKENN